MTVKIVAVLSERVVQRTVKKRGVPTVIHEREIAYRLECGHEVARRRPINRAMSKPRTRLRCEFCAAKEDSAA